MYELTIKLFANNIRELLAVDEYVSLDIEVNFFTTH